MDSAGFRKLTTLHRKTFVGKEVEEIIPQLGELRISVFKEFPYLYEGDLDYEMNYLKIYTQDEKSIVHCIFDGDLLVGASTGMPLSKEAKEIQSPFLEKGFELSALFYFGESILLNDYRGLGIGHEFFDVREKHALDLNFSTTTFCSVVRPENHVLKPESYRSNDVFWTKRGYQRQNFSCEMSWLDRSEEGETTKQLQFWLRQWK